MTTPGRKYAFAVAGTQSGCGKTSITLGLLAAFRSRGLRVQPFKVGPDFIDPGFHTQVAGVESRNLDGWMLLRNYNEHLFGRLLSPADMGVVEGAMGVFDGFDGVSEAGSTAQIAKWLDIPVILVIDARSMARSAAALVHGFTRFDPHMKIAGVLFNRIGSPTHLEYLKEAVEANVPEVAVLGGIPREEAIRIPERHLGLVTADEIRLGREWIANLRGLVERHVDLDRILQKVQYSGTANPGPLLAPVHPESEPVTVAVARDAAFCFYYPDNLDLLRQAGAAIHFFSPLAGESFPADTAGIYLGGGYPEVHAEALARLRTEGFFLHLRHSAQQCLPIYAECGGMMALGQFIDTADGHRYPMAGLLPFGTRMLNRRKALGYTEVVLRRKCLLGEPGLHLRGHEFHYSEIVHDGESSGPDGVELAYAMRSRKGGTASQEGFMTGSVLASYVHLHWGSAPEAAANFVNRCIGYRNRVTHG